MSKSESLCNWNEHYRRGCFQPSCFPELIYAQQAAHGIKSFLIHLDSLETKHHLMLLTDFNFSDRINKLIEALLLIKSDQGSSVLRQMKNF